MIASPVRTAFQEPTGSSEPAARSPYRPVPPPPTRRQELRRAAAVQAAWLADLR